MESVSHLNLNRQWQSFEIREMLHAVSYVVSPLELAND